MTEHIFELSEHTDTTVFYGVNNANIQVLKNLHPNLRLMARGHVVKISGSDEEADRLIDNIKKIERFCLDNNSLSEENVIEIIKGNAPDEIRFENLILHGVNGKSIMARTANQQKLVKDFETNDLLFAIGPAGSGKTYTAIALAVRSLKNREIKKIILSRPAVEAGEKLGFLPGELKEYMENGTIQIAPLAFMRGRTLSDAVVILDEAQNTTTMQIKMFLTRMGLNTKMIVTGDMTQIDLPYAQKSGLIDALEVLKNVKGIAKVEFDVKDIVRHKLVQRIVEAYGKRIPPTPKGEKEEDKKEVLILKK
jgi:phosphate starvation-inducible PhoH-like protein